MIAGLTTSDRHTRPPQTPTVRSSTNYKSSVRPGPRPSNASAGLLGRSFLPGQGPMPMRILSLVVVATIILAVGAIQIVMALSVRARTPDHISPYGQLGACRDCSASSLS